MDAPLAMIEVVGWSKVPALNGTPSMEYVTFERDDGDDDDGRVDGHHSNACGDDCHDSLSEKNEMLSMLRAGEEIEIFFQADFPELEPDWSRQVRAEHLPLGRSPSFGSAGLEVLSEPYAQLCHDPKSGSLVTILHVVTTDDDQKALKPLDRVVFDQQDHNLPSPPASPKRDASEFTTWNHKGASHSTGSTQEMGSSFSFSSGEEEHSELEETYYLLGTRVGPALDWKDEAREKAGGESKGNCAEALFDLLRQLRLSNSKDWRDEEQQVVVSYETLED